MAHDRPKKSSAELRAEADRLDEEERQREAQRMDMRRFVSSLGAFSQALGVAARIMAARKEVIYGHDGKALGVRRVMEEQ